MQLLADGAWPEGGGAAQACEKRGREGGRESLRLKQL